MATRSPSHGRNDKGTGSFGPTALTVDEHAILEKRRRDVQNYEPVKLRSKERDPVSGEYSEIAMVNRASILLMFCILDSITPSLLKRKVCCFLLTNSSP